MHARSLAALAVVSLLSCQAPAPESRDSTQTRSDDALTVTTTAEFDTASRSTSLYSLGNQLTLNHHNFGVQAWAPTTAALPDARAGQSAFVHNDVLFVVGGSSALFTPTTSIVSSALNTDGSPVGFTANRALPVSMHGQASIAHSGFLYVVGGEEAGTGSPHLTVDVAVIGAGGALGPWNTAATLPSGAGRIWHSLSVWKNWLYLVGGSASGASPLVWVAPIHPDGSLGTFALTSAMAEGRQLNASVAANGWLYVSGGQQGTTNHATVVAAPIGSDGQLGSFRTVGTLPSGRFGHTMVVENGALYVLGGNTGGSFSNAVLAARLNADGSLGSFATINTFATGRARHASTVWNNTLYVIGGENASVARSDVQFAQLFHQEQGGVRAWSSNDPLNSARTGHAMARAGSWLYVTGGRDVNDAPTNNVQVAFEQTTFLPANSTFTTARSNHSSFVYRGRLYVAGGQNAANAPLNDIQVATIGASGSLPSTFTTLSATLPTPRYGAQMLVHNDRLYVIGGFNTARLNDVWYANFDSSGNLGPWTSTSSFITARWGHSAAIIGNFLYVVGGSGASGIRSDVQVAPILSSGALGTFTFTSTMNQARTLLGVAVWNDMLVTVGGTTTGGLTVRTTDHALLNEDGTLRPWVYDTDVIIPRGGATLDVFNGSLLTVGGNAPALASTEIAPLTGALGRAKNSSTDRPLPVALDLGPCATSLDDRLFVVGGATATDSAPPVLSARVTGAGLGPFVTHANTQGTTFPFSGCAVIRDQLYATGRDVVAATLLPDGGITAFTTLSTAAFDGSGVAAWNGRLYFTGGANVGNPDPDSRTWSFTPTDGGLLELTPLPALRTGHATVAHAGQLFVVGGYDDTGASTHVFSSPILADGSLGAWVETSSLPEPVGYASAFARDGFLYLVSREPALPRGGKVWVAAIVAPGQVGEWRKFTDFAQRNLPAVTEVGGQLFVLGGGTGVTATTQVDRVSFTAPAMKGVWSRRIDLGVPMNVDSLTLNGSSAPLGTFNARWRFDSANDWGTEQAVFNVKPGEVTQIGASGVKTVWLELELDERATAPLTRLVDLRNLGDVQLATSFPAVVVTATPSSVPPRGTSTLSCSGGTGTGYVWSLSTNASGGMVSGTGAYTAGSTPNVVDVARCVDSMGNAGTTQVTVRAGVSLSPSSVTVAPLDFFTFTANGGSGTGYSWSLITNASGGMLTAGAYAAGPTPGVDVVQVVDSLGNSATASVTVQMMVIDAGTPDAGTPDAGVPDAGEPDAGTEVDAGTSDAGETDAGTEIDAGSDAGTLTDAGIEMDAGVDAGAETDAGTQTDAGMPDAGVSDAGLTPTDAGAEEPPDAGMNNMQPTGCGCSTDILTSPLWLAALLALRVQRRRRAA